MPKSTLLVLLLAGAVLPAAAQTTPLPRLPEPFDTRPEALAPNLLPRLTSTFRLVQRLDQTYYHGAWADTVRYSYSRFSPASNARSVLFEQASPKAGTPFRSNQLTRFTINAAEQTTLDTTYTYSTSGIRTFSRNQGYTYNAQGQLAQAVEQAWSGTSWRDAYRNTYTYNAAGQLATRLWQTSNGTSWENLAKIVWTYDAQGRLTQYEYLYAPPASTTFEPSTKILFSYDANSHLLTQLYQYYRLGVYTDYVRYTCSYNAAGQLQSVVTEVTQGNNVWQPDHTEQYSYDADGNQTQILVRAYVAATTSYVDYYRSQYTYERVTAAAAAHALAAGLTVVPNPAARGNAQLRFQLPTAGPATMEVLDLTGRVVARRPVPAAAAAQSLELGALNLTTGVYVVRLSAGGRSQQTRLVVP